MILVFYITLAVICGICILTLLIYLSKIEINIKNLYMNSESKKRNNENVIISISLKLWRIQWFSLKMDKNKMSSLYAKMKIKEYKHNKDIKNKIKRLLKACIQDKRIIKLASNLSIEIEELKSEIFLGTEDTIVTSYLVAAVAIIISNVIPHIIKNSDNTIQYKVLPIYKQKYIYILKLDSIINIKIMKIIQIMLEVKRIIRLNNDKYKNEKIKSPIKIRVHVV